LDLFSRRIKSQPWSRIPPLHAMVSWLTIIWLRLMAAMLWGSRRRRSNRSLMTAPWQSPSLCCLHLFMSTSWRALAVAWFANTWTTQSLTYKKSWIILSLFFLYRYTDVNWKNHTEWFGNFYCRAQMIIIDPSGIGFLWKYIIMYK